MREDRQGVDEIELSVLIAKFSRKCIALKLSEGQMLPAPLNQYRIIVRTVHFRPTQGFPLADHTPNATAEVEKSIETFELDAGPFGHLPDLLRRDFTGAEKYIRAAVLCDQVDQVTRRDRRPTHSMTKPVRPKRNVLCECKNIAFEAVGLNL